MAFFRRDKSGRVIVEYWDAALAKKTKLLRKDIKFLDSWEDHEIDKWVDRWEQENGPKVERAKKTNLLEDDEVAALFNRFIDSYAVRKKISKSTVALEKNRFFKHIIPVMVGDFEKKDVRSWGLSLDALDSALLAKGELREEQVNKCLGLLKRFSRHLKRIGILAQSWDVQYTSVPKRSTPLIAPKSPHDVLKFLHKQKDIRVKLMGYLAYFASLRPEEIFPLKRSDFLAGDEAIGKSVTYARFQKIEYFERVFVNHKFRILDWPVESITQKKFRKIMNSKGVLGSRLTIHVKQSMDGFGEINDHTKKENLQRRKASLRKEAEIESKGEYITLWHEQAAKELAGLLKSLPKGRLFNVGRKRLFEVWMNESEKSLKASLRDLRRASGLYLGRTLDIPATLLQDHMRHEDFETTLKYMRHPLVADPEVKEANFDDV